MEKNLTLYDLENNLTAFLDTAEGGVAPEQAAEFEKEFLLALEKTVEKRDRVAQFLAFCEAQQAFAVAEMERLAALKVSYWRAAERVKGYVTRVLEALGLDEKGRWRKLEGRTCLFTLCNNPVSVEITAEAEVPAEFKAVSITVSMHAWQRLLEAAATLEQNTDDAEWAAIGRLAARMAEAAPKAVVSLHKREIKGILEDGGEVPGARLAIGNVTLVRK
jgi:hypothetical protein